MRCDKFKCVYEVDGECEEEGGECIGECTDCQEQAKKERYGLK